MSVRKADQRDAARLAEIIRSLGWFVQLDKETPEVASERVGRHLGLCAEDHSHSVYVAELEGEVAGYISVHWLPYLILSGPEGYVSELFIHEASRGQGVGTQLLEVVKAEARQRGCSRLMLINNRNRESYRRQFYEKHGWQERAEMADFVLAL